ncbi:Na/Pi cotransporter family protein [Flavobacterium lacus]|uniref:Phosphate:Na+ symporter n=1 Tax=Flavobacterium lacus TaxID=1353778 RepID=A0A328WYP2_9FLAO|nr:Na/Pi symporter [Flavobacterium lacus]RAR50395.1 phosphate:Na+ symporter [Flavobacterium lacus]
MHWSDFDIWKFLAGLGIFMYGMFLLEEAIKQLSGKAFKIFIRKSTTGRIRSIFTGLFSTAVLQSSSAVTLMTLTFVGAGMISMQNAIGVVMGTNLGTTATSWLVATIGFKINIEGLFLPLIGLGGLGLIFLSKSPRYNGISRLLVGLGFLFMGLEYMKLSVEGFTSSFDLASIPHYGMLFYVLIAIVMTSVMQSSSATIAIILTALHTGLITFSEGAAMVIGANIGTTTTVMLGALGGIAIKKQVALSHLIFNIFTGVVAFLSLPLLTKLILYLLSEDNNAVLGVTLFHTIFNLLGVLLFLPFIGILVKLLQSVYPEKRNETTQFISNATPDLPEAALVAVRNETMHVFKVTLDLIGLVYHLNQSKTKDERWFFSDLLFNTKKDKTPIDLFNNILSVNKSIIVFASKIPVNDLEELERRELTHYNHMVITLSQVAKTVISIGPEIDEIESSENPTVSQLMKLICDTTNSNLVVLHKIAESSVEKQTLEVYNNQIKQDYKMVVEKIAETIEKKLIQEKDISLLLMVNGIATQTIRQLFRTLEKLV